MDVEGVDLDVLKGLDFDRYSPEVICIENWASVKGIEAVLSSEIHRLLVGKQYQLAAWGGLSTIYKRD